MPIPIDPKNLEADGPKRSRPVHLARLCHHRWTVPILAELCRDDGAKFVTLVHRLQAPRAAVREAMDHLQTLGLACPNPGTGHPLRPEFVLTSNGEVIGPACLRLTSLVGGLGLGDIAYRKWFLASLLCAHAGARRFGEFRTHLAGITDRALSFSLADLCSAALLDRSVRNAAPPVPWYMPTVASNPIGSALEIISSGGGFGSAPSAVRAEP